MAVLQGAVLPQGSLILVTGANGYVGSHVIDQFLKHKYRVRGLVRDIKKSAWVATYFHEHYGADEFELVEAKDLTDVDVMKKALEGKIERRPGPETTFLRPLHGVRRLSLHCLR